MNKKAFTDRDVLKVAILLIIAVVGFVVIREIISKISP